MFILFDQGTPVGIRQVLSKDTVRTAREQGWDALLNGELIRAAEDAGFDVLLTTDTSIPYQQNLIAHRLAIVVLSWNRWKLIRLVLPKIASAVAAAKPGTFSIVEIGE